MALLNFVSAATAVVLLAVGTDDLALSSSLRAAIGDFKPPPEPEPIAITELPLPPVSPSAAEGSCSITVNPAGTGCIVQQGGLIQGGSFLPDNKHVTATVNFTGAPAAPDPASVYVGEQIIIVKTEENVSFPNGDAWKCITCGIPEANDHGRLMPLDYPQAFHDGKRVLVGSNVVDCGDAELATDECTPEKTHIYPIRWNTSPDGSGPGGAIREQRLHPDNLHLGWSSFGLQAGRLTQYAYFGRLSFNPSPTRSEPLAPRFDLVNITTLHSEAAEQQPWLVDNQEDQHELRRNPHAIQVGELRGFSGTGNEATYIGFPAESSNIDVFAVDLASGAVRRITQHPEYCDPLDISPDDQWTVVMDTRGSGRQMFMAGMRHVPPVTDLLTSTVASSTRNNGARRFFQPYLLDRDGDRGMYFGQRLNAQGDANWNGRADPKWSPDGTSIVYWQALVVAPACGGENPLPCPNSTEPGGRTERLMLARLTARTPLPLPVEPVAPVSDDVPWGTKYEPGSALPTRPMPPAGTYTLRGAVSGSAAITITDNANGTAIESIAVAYANYSDVPWTVLNGWENVTVAYPSATLNVVEWFSELVQTGTEGLVTKTTSAEGFRLEIDVLANVFEASGRLETSINGTVYRQPANGT